MQLEDRVALVTGAGRRIGRHIALDLARSGCHLGIHYRHAREEAEQLAEEIRQLGRQAVTLQADLQKSEQLEPLVTRLADRCGGIDLLVNNAAAFGPTAWGSSQPDDWIEPFQVNALAPVMLAQACWPLFQQRGGGCIVNLTDIYADRPLASYAAYSASKAALVSVTRSLARLMAPTVRVNAVAPGVGLFAESYKPEERRAALNKVPLRRSGTPRDVAGAVLFLVRGGDYITGQTLVVDGGRSIAW
jgi:pteridine reductase